MRYSFRTVYFKFKYCLAGYVVPMRIIISLFLIFFNVAVQAQVLDSTAFRTLKDALVKLQNSDLMRHGTVGFALSDTTTDSLLIGLNVDKSLPPASTVKLITTATALEVLGENFTFETYLEHDGSLLEGVLKGNLYIYGTGDPTLGSPRFKDKTDSATVFNDWLTALKNAGIQRIEGRIIADNSFYEEQGIEESWMWGDVGTAYGVAIQGLNWNENATRLYFKPGRRVGEPATLLRSVPEQPEIRYDNRVTTGPPGSGNKTRIRPDLISRTLIIEGTLPMTRGEYGIRVAVIQPALLVATQFTAFLKKNDIPVTQLPSTLLPKRAGGDRIRLHTFHSPPLSEICKQINWWSINLYADALLKAVGKKHGLKTNFRDVAPEIVSFWAAKGIETSGMLLKDGSGLATTALLTPHNLVTILNKTTQLSTFSTFYNSLPVAGEAGTVRSRRFGNKSNVRAKSGSIEGTRAYAGYVKTGSGRLLSFVINAHRYTPDAQTEISRELMKIVSLIGQL